MALMPSHGECTEEYDKYDIPKNTITRFIEIIRTADCDVPPNANRGQLKPFPPRRTGSRGSRRSLRHSWRAPKEYDRYDIYDIPKTVRYCEYKNNKIKYHSRAGLCQAAVFLARPWMAAVIARGPYNGPAVHGPRRELRT